MAAAARRTHDDLAAVLAPLISETGVEALSGRAFQLAQREYPAVARAGDGPATDEPFAAVAFWLENQNRATATEASAAMFATFAQLLTALIGEQLTMRYLEKAWPDVFSEAKRKRKKA